MSKVSDLPEVITPDTTDLLYMVDVSAGTGGAARITFENVKTATSLTAAEVKTKYESNADTNAFTDADVAKLAGIEAGATTDQIASEVPFTNTGTDLVATDVQAALEELDLRTLPLFVHAVTGLLATYTAGAVRFQDTVYQVAAGNIALSPSITDGTIYVDTDGIVKQTGSGVNPPAGTVPMATFSTSGVSITELNDIRSIANNSSIVGLVGDIVTLTANGAAAAGATGRYADAAHQHAITTGTPVSTGTANAAGSGTGLAFSNHVHDTALAYQTAVSIIDDTTTSVTDTAIASMSITLAVAGRYSVRFSASTINSGNGAERNYFSIYENGVQIADSERKVGIAGGAYVGITCDAVTGVMSAGQVIDVRWRVIAGTGTVHYRTLIATRLGAT